jgi:predicted phosphate transport protein (TIGR00153 family)
MVMLFKLFPRSFNFFDLFEKQVNCAVSAAKYFKELASQGAISDAALEKMQDIEHEGDDVAHNIIEQLNKTFITPFDREDIHRLAKELDDVIDMFNTIVSRLKVYKVTRIDKNLIEFACVIEQSVNGVSCAVKGLRNMKHCKAVSEACVEINRLENVGDAMRDRMLAKLFESEKDPIEVIKWKEIYQDAETVLDICEDVAHVVDSILVKQA